MSTEKEFAWFKYCEDWNASDESGERFAFTEGFEAGEKAERDRVKKLLEYLEMPDHIFNIEWEVPQDEGEK